MKQKVALVLGSGGARGTAHIGVIRELLKNDYEITSISGSSMGALVGGVYASGKLDEYETWLCSLSKMDVFNLVDFTLSTKGIIKADRVFKAIQKFIPDMLIEDLPIKFSAVATDLKQKKEIVITEGSLFEAIRASISIPLVITPASKNDTLFLDGGVLNPVPVNRVERNIDDILIAVNLSEQIAYKKPIIHNSDWAELDSFATKRLKIFRNKLSEVFPVGKRDGFGYFNIINETSNLMLSQILKLTLEMTPPDILINISKNACGTFDFYKATEMIELGKNHTRLALEKKFGNTK